MDKYQTTAVEAFDNAVCSLGVSHTIRTLRHLGVSDDDIAAAMFAGLRTLLPGITARPAWGALLLDTATELFDGR